MTNLARSFGQQLLKRVGRVAGRFQEERALRSDLLESEDEYLIIFDVPGATTTDLDVRFEAGVVTVHVERFREYREGYTMRFPGRGQSLNGTRRLPDEATVNADEARARLEPNGTVAVFLPKEEPGFDQSTDESNPFGSESDDWATPTTAEEGADSQSGSAEPSESA